MKIITNTASGLTEEAGRRLGIEVLPVSVYLGGKSMRDYIDISPEEFVELLHGEEMPVSSQPSVGDMLAQMEDATEETVSPENTVPPWASAATSPTGIPSM